MKLLVLDGNSILNRAFYGIKLLTTKSGEFTNGIVGFLNILEKVKDETEPDAVAIAFDMKAPTFRHKAYAGYKAQRKGMPPELAAQMPVLKELLGDLGYQVTVVDHAQAAFDEATRQMPDVLLIDVQLPGLSGNAAVFQLRSHGYRGCIVTLSPRR